MLYLTWQQNTGGRSCHKLRELFTTFVYQYFLQSKFDVCVFPNQTWLQKDQRLIPRDRLGAIIDCNDPYIPEEHTLRCSRFWETRHWKGIQKFEFEQVLSDITNWYTDLVASGETKRACVVFSGKGSINAKHMCDWGYSQEIVDDIVNIFQSKFAKLKPDNVLREEIAVHVRRGDMYHALVEGGTGFPRQVQLNLIKHLYETYKLPVRIYTENVKTYDVTEMFNELRDSGMPIDINYGSRTCTYMDFYAIANSAVIAPHVRTLFSIWACYAKHPGVPVVVVDEYIGKKDGYKDFPKYSKDVVILKQADLL